MPSDSLNFVFFSRYDLQQHAKASRESLEYQVGNCDLSLRKESSLYLFDVSAAAFTHKAASGNDEQFQNCLFSNSLYIQTPPEKVFGHRKHTLNTQELFGCLGIAIQLNYPELPLFSRVSLGALQHFPQVPGQKRKFVPHVIEPSLGLAVPFANSWV